MSLLFEKTALGPLPLQNRFVMSPLTRCRCIGNVPNDLVATYYGQRASAGLIISEGTSPSPNGIGYARIPGIYSPEQVAGWKKVTAAAHAGGAKMFVQLMHCGRIAHPLNLPAGARIIAPSAVAAAGEMWTDAEGMKPNATPAAMSAADIKSTLEEFVQGAKNAIAAIPPATKSPLYRAGMISPPGLTFTNKMPMMVAKIVTPPNARGYKIGAVAPLNIVKASTIAATVVTA